MTANPLHYVSRPDYGHDEVPVDGVLLTNLGTPDAPDTASVRRYLAEFLWDPRVIEVKRWLWWLILHGVILRVRPSRSAAAYREVWAEAGSPLLTIGRDQRDALAAALGSGMRVALGMRYGSPSIADALGELREAGVRRLVVLPLYPQYAASTTGSTFDALSAELTRWRWLPELRFVASYHDDPGYVGAVAASIEEQRRAEGDGEHLVFSFHGLPRRYLDAGDPYHCQCHKSARLVAERLGLAPERWSVSFQSRVGREPWLEPYTEAHLEALAGAGIRRVDVVCPGFSADCLETLEEIALRAAETFTAAGGERLRYVPALNTRADHVAALASLLRAKTQDWRAQPTPAPRADLARSLGAAR